MASPVFEDAVAGDHYHRIGHRQPHHFLRNIVVRHHAASLAVARETLLGEALTRGGPLEIAVTDAAHPPLPPLIEYRRREIGHARRVGVSFGSHVEAASTGAIHHA